MFEDFFGHLFDKLTGKRTPPPPPVVDPSAVDRAVSSSTPVPHTLQTPHAPLEKSRLSTEAFHACLERAYGGPIRLRINDNTSTLLSVQRPRAGQPLRFSIHRMFLNAPEEVIAALGQYARRATPACQRMLRAYMDENQDQLRSARVPTPRVMALRARGTTYDLNAMAEEVNRDWFGGTLQYYITWSRGEAGRKRRRHIIFGSWDHRARLIRIHPALDSPKVPEYFVRFVIYHEMIHAALDPPLAAARGSRRIVHSAEFRRREKQYPDYARAIEWEKKFMGGGSLD